MDIGVTSHMKANKGNLMSYFNMNKNIIVGNGHNISVIGYGDTSLPTSLYSFNLHSVLHAPKLIKKSRLY